MRTIILATAIAAAMAGGTAFAGQATGTIRSISKARDTITLADGKTFHLPEAIEVESLKVGEQVRISYAVEKGKARQVSHIRPVQ